MIEVGKGQCTISRQLDIEGLEWQMLMKMGSLWASHGCSMDSPGCYKYTFDCKEEMPSPQELKEANELLDKVGLRLLDLSRIITVAKFVIREEFPPSRIITVAKVVMRDEIERQERRLEEKVSKMQELLEAVQMKENLTRADFLNEVTRLSKRISDLDPKHLRVRDLRNKIRGKFSIRVERALLRTEDSNIAEKPIEELTDDELLSIRNIGRKALGEIRQVFPAPINESG